MTAALLLWFLAAQPPDIARLDEAARANPNDAAAWKNLGVALAARQRLEAALPAFEKACSLDPREEDVCYYLARTLYSLDRWEEARGPFEKALRAASKPKLARVHRAAALNCLALGRQAEAERHFLLAVELNPGPEQLPEDPRIDYGAFLFREGRIEEALTLLNQAAKAAPGAARAHAEYGRVLLQAGQTEAAARELEQAVRLDPRAWNVRLLLGRAWLQLGRAEAGKRELEIAREGWKKDQGSSTVR